LRKSASPQEFSASRASDDIAEVWRDYDRLVDGCSIEAHSAWNVPLLRGGSRVYAGIAFQLPELLMLDFGASVNLPRDPDLVNEEGPTALIPVRVPLAFVVTLAEREIEYELAGYVRVADAHATAYLHAGPARFRIRDDMGNVMGTPAWCSLPRNAQPLRDFVSLAAYRRC
jgi:hypothetical protein